MSGTSQKVVSLLKGDGHSGMFAGATVNFQGQHGRTPLHKAAEKAFPVLIKALCEARADPDSRDHFGALLDLLVTKIWTTLSTWKM